MPINTPEIASSSSALAANPSRKGWAIQNLGTNPLYVRLDASASTTVFHFILKACAVQDDGSGGFYSDTVHLDQVTIAGTSPRYVVTEMSFP